MTERTAFLAHLHRGGKWTYIWTAEGSRSAWYPVGKPMPSLGDGARNLYFGIHPSDEIPETNARGEPARPEAVRARRSQISAVNCLFAEFDAHGPDADKDALLARILALDPPPSAIVDSGGGYHCYWLLADPFPIRGDEERGWIDRLQKGWVARVGGDDGSKDLARMLRLPGSYNCKYAPPRPVRWVRCDLDRLYDLEDLEALARPAIQARRAARAAGAGFQRPLDLEAVARVVSWLSRLAPWRCDAYEAWIEVGMSLRELGQIGLLLWDLWSQSSDKYEPGVCADKWATFHPAGGLTLGSLAYWADEDDPPQTDEGDSPQTDKVVQEALEMRYT